MRRLWALLLLVALASTVLAVADRLVEARARRKKAHGAAATETTTDSPKAATTTHKKAGRGRTRVKRTSGPDLDRDVHPHVRPR